jgi:hypothetical protein
MPRSVRRTIDGRTFFAFADRNNHARHRRRCGRAAPGLGCNRPIGEHVDAMLAAMTAPINARFDLPFTAPFPKNDQDCRPRALLLRRPRGYLLGLQAPLSPIRDALHCASVS